MDDELYEEDYIEDDEYDKDYIPPGCRACGGNHPRCTTSCPLFDE